MKKRTQEIDLKLLSTNLKFISEQEELIDFIKDFTGISINENKNLEPNIHVHLKINKRFSMNKKFSKISRSIWLADDTVYISKIERLPGLSFKVDVKNDKLYVDAFLLENKFNLLKNLLPSCLLNKKYRLFKSIILVYYLLYIPYYYFLEHFRNLYLLHAGAINYKQNGIILAGLGGIGKSTFSLGALSIDGCKILSDNLIFHDKQKIFSFPEPIALDRKSMNILGKTEAILIESNIASSHGRMFYKIKPEIYCSEATPKYLFWLQQGSENKFSKIKIKGNFIRKLLNINFLANELREYYIIAATLDLAFSKALSSDLYYKNLSTLLSNVDCYILEFKPGVDIKAVFDETLAKIIS